jgi:hypothetical protein
MPEQKGKGVIRIVRGMASGGLYTWTETRLRITLLRLSTFRIPDSHTAREVARQKRLSDLHLERSDSPACKQGGSTS